MTPESLLLSQSDVESIINMDEVCEIVEETFRNHGRGAVVLPAKITLDINPVDHQAWMNAMPAFVEPMQAAGIKWAGGFVNNPRAYNLPYVMATIILNDPVTGQTLAVLDGVHITNARTGAAAAVSARLAALPDTRVVTFIGAGVQARWTLRALQRYFALDEVHIVDNNLEAANRYIEEMQAETGIPIRTFASGDEAAEGSQVIFTCTPADRPLLHDTAIAPGTTIVSLGSYQEVDDEFVLHADKIIVDSLEQCMHRGELARLFECGRLKESHIYAELGEIAAGLKTGRHDEDERVLVVPIGLGSLDIAVARKVVTRAEETGIGQRFAFSA